MEAANQHAGNGSENAGLMSGVLGRLGQQGPNTNINEDAVQQHHDQAYNQGNASSLGAGAMGSSVQSHTFQSVC